MRKKLIIGNWKMNLTVKESLELAKSLAGTNFPPTIDVAVCPTYVSLAPVSVMLEKSSIQLGAQDVNWMESGTYTGEVSSRELQEMGVKYVLVGHSERRKYLNEDDHLVNKKMLHLVNTDLIPVLCVGEDYSTRQKGESNKFVNQQLTKDLDGISIKSADQLVVAYEPIWAISDGDPYKTKQMPTSEDIKKMSFYIRKTLVRTYGQKLAGDIRIIYGGSANAANTLDYLDKAEMQGLLVGGASLKLPEFSKIIHLANE